MSEIHCNRMLKTFITKCILQADFNASNNILRSNWLHNNSFLYIKIGTHVKYEFVMIYLNAFADIWLMCTYFAYTCTMYNLRVHVAYEMKFILILTLSTKYMKITIVAITLGADIT